jgi:hypothetical protein
MTPRTQRLELLLKNRGLGTALFHPVDPPEQRFSTGIESLDLLLSGGFPRGHISEISGPISSGKTSLMLTLLSRATQQGEVVACIDTNQLDPFSAQCSGMDLEKLLWIRCQQEDQILKAGDILCRAGNFGIIALDLHLSPGGSLTAGSHIWFRLQRAVEETRTVLLMFTPRPIARNAARTAIQLRRCDLQWRGGRVFWKLLQGFSIEVRSASHRSQVIRSQVSSLQTLDIRPADLMTCDL